MIGSIADLLLIVLGFGILIFVHELGHFVAAKWAGIRAEAFAVGMGPVALAWRKNIGLKFSSTLPEYTRRAYRDLVDRKIEPKGSNEKGEPAYSEAQILEGADRLDLGETEYSLRWLPIGGFVKMLGQEDMNPNKISDDPRSYNSRPIGKRMIVVSAGVIMNIIFAAILYVIAFSIGVQFEAPVLGGVDPSMPAASAVALNAEELNVNSPGIHSSDRVLSIDDNPVHTFADIQISTAMAKPDQPLRFVVIRPGIDEHLQFEITPKKDTTSGLLGIGVAPASSATLQEDMDELGLQESFNLSPLPAAGVEPAMTLLTADGESVATYEQFQNIVNRLDGRGVATTWAMLDANDQPQSIPVEVTIESVPALQRLVKSKNADGVYDYEFGLFGLVPITTIVAVDEKSLNHNILKRGDLIWKIADSHAPTTSTFREIITQHVEGTIEIVVLRDGEQVAVSARIDSGGKLGVYPGPALDSLYIAPPIERIAVRTNVNSAERTMVDSPIAPFNLLPGTRVVRVGDVTVDSWRDLREQAKAQTADAFAQDAAAMLELTIVHPTPGAETEALALALSDEQVASLHGLRWQSTLSAILFESLMTTRKADNPLNALSIGIEETGKTMILTYLTIDRLIRGSVGVEQLRGPVGIVHIGSKIADKGLIYVLYFLAIISVNLAVINFLPLPIVDGGLFLFLVYEKFKGRPPSPSFQHWAIVAGLFMIGTAFLVVTWNDVMRLIP